MTKPYSLHKLKLASLGVVAASALGAIAATGINVSPAHGIAMVCYSGSSIPGSSVPCGNNTFDNFSSDIPNISNVLVERNESGDYEVLVQVDPSLGNPPAGPFTFAYDMTLSNKVFGAAALDSLVDPLPPNGETVTKELFDSPNSNQPFLTLTSVNGAPDVGTIGGLDFLRVVDTVTIPVGGNFDGFENDFDEVPEPLTILGSGLALGFGTLFKGKQKKKQEKDLG